MNEENIIDVDQNETDTCEEIADTDTISGEDKSCHRKLDSKDC